MRPRSRLLRRGLLAGALALGAAGTVPAQDQAADEARTTERIRAERAAADATYERKARECAQHFVVTSCVEAARAERHATQIRLDREQQALDEARRQRRAEEREKAIASKTAGDEAQAREAAARARSEARPAASAPVRAAPLPASGAASRTAKPVPDAAQRAEQEARARRAYELKQLQAEAHRREVEQRNAERARKTNPGAPLPVPAASAASAAPRR